MLTSILAKSLATCSASCGGNLILASKQTAAVASKQIFLQQVREFRFFKAIRPYKLRRNFYGRNPLLQEDEFDQAREAGELEQLALEKVRFATLPETNSPFFDRYYDQFTRYIMEDGKKSHVYHIVDDALYRIKVIQTKKLQKRRQAEAKAKAEGKEFRLSDEEEQEIELNPMAIFKQAMLNVKPVVITNKVKRGGATYNVPYPVEDRIATVLAIKWMHAATRDRPRPKLKSYSETLAQELLDAYYNQGKVIKRRDDMHKLAEANRAYAHYRWG